MRRDEQDEYGEEARDVIEGLRRLARADETPPDLLPTVLAQGEQLLPSRRRGIARWWDVIVARPPRLLIWGPAVAVSCFIAGVFISPPQFGPMIESQVTEKKDTPLDERMARSKESLSRDDARDDARDDVRMRSLPAAAPSLLSQQKAEESFARDETMKEEAEVRSLVQEAAPPRVDVPASSQPTKMMASRLQRQPALPLQREITATLPSTLYKRLQQEAQRRDVDISTLLREAVEAYVQAERAED